MAGRRIIPTNVITSVIESEQIKLLEIQKGFNIGPYLNISYKTI